MKKTAVRLAASLLLLVLCAASAAAGDILPAGTIIGRDGQGDAVHQVRVNGVDIGYKLLGWGKPLVLIMGLGGTMDQWPQSVLSELASSRQLILMDNRGMGHSTADAAPFSYKLFASDVVGLLDALGIDRADVLGFSMGSTITQELLLDHPQRIGKAVICATSTDGSNVAKALSGRTWDNPTVKRQIEATVSWRTPLDRMRAVSNPVLFVVGTADTVVGPQSSQTLAATVPAAWLVQFRDASHGLIWEAPAAFTRIVQTFLETDAAVVRK